MRYFVPALAALLITAPLAHADEVSDAVAAIPGAIEDVRLVGNWTMDGSQGAYRLVNVRVGKDFSASRLFVQWLEMTDAGTITLKHTLEIGDLTQLGVGIVDYSTETDDQGLSVFIETLDPTNNTGATYELFVFGPDEYRFGPASN